MKRPYSPPAILCSVPLRSFEVEWLLTIDRHAPTVTAAVVMMLAALSAMPAMRQIDDLRRRSTTPA